MGRCLQIRRQILLALAGSIVLALSGCGDPPPPTTPAPASPFPSPSSPSGASVTHRLVVSLEIPHLADPVALAALSAGFDAFLYGHPGTGEEAVASLRARGLESLRYFNVFHTDPLYPRWGGHYAELHDFLLHNDGWIKGVSYRYYSNPRDPDRIIDHTRSEITAGVRKGIAGWAVAIGADRVFLDLTFDELSDWMIFPGERWPWPPADHGSMNRRWRRNMQWLVDGMEESFPVMINGSVKLRAGAVLYESQVWNHRRGWSRWEDLVMRMMSGETIPALHVGHHLLAPWEIAAGEEMTLAVWLLGDEGYLLVEPQGRPLAWAREIQARRLQHFTPAGVAAEVARGVWRREGRIDGEAWVVEVDLVRERGRVERLIPR